MLYFSLIFNLFYQCLLSIKDKILLSGTPHTIALKYCSIHDQEITTNVKNIDAYVIRRKQLY